MTTLYNEEYTRRFNQAHMIALLAKWLGDFESCDPRYWGPYNEWPRNTYDGTCLWPKRKPEVAS